MFTFNSSYCPIGLDISDLSFKMVQIKKNGGTCKIQALSRVVLPEGVISGGFIQDRQKASVILNKLMSKPEFGKIKSDKIVACLPEPKTFVKLIDIPKTPNSVNDLIESEIKKNIPLSLDDIYYDWQMIEEGESKDLILIGASPKNIVNEYSSFLDENGFLIEALEIEPIAICRSVLKEEHLEEKDKSFSRGNYIILDIGATRSSMILYSKNAILLSMSVNVSIDDINNDKSRSVSKIVKKIKETKIFLNKYFSDRGELSHVLICGGGGLIKNLINDLEDKTSLKVFEADPLDVLGKDKKIIRKHFSDLKYYPPAFATAIGLSLRGTNLKK